MVPLNFHVRLMNHRILIPFVILFPGIGMRNLRSFILLKGTMKLQLLTETFSVHAGEVAVINAAKLHAASGDPYCELQSLVSPLS